jgi:TonB family protein
MILRMSVAILIAGGMHYWAFFSQSVAFEPAQIQLQSFPSSLELVVTSPARVRVKEELHPKKEETLPVEKEEKKKVEAVEEKAPSVGSIKQGALQPAVLEGQAPPTYPMLARARKIEGKVVLVIEVLESGLCGQVHIKESSGHLILDEAAVEGVRKWRFEPAQIGGKPAPSQIEIPIIFKLNENK